MDSLLILNGAHEGHRHNTIRVIVIGRRSHSRLISTYPDVPFSVSGAFELFFRSEYKPLHFFFGHIAIKHAIKGAKVFVVLGEIDLTPPLETGADPQVKRAFQRSSMRDHLTVVLIFFFYVGFK